MKKILLTAIVFITSFAAMAQKEVGTIQVQPKVGITIANLTDLDGNDSKIGMIAGAEFSYTILPVIDIEAGLLYSMQGAKWSAEVGDCKMKLEYINVPLMASAQLYKGLRIRTGVQFGFLTKSSGDYDLDNDVDLKDNTKKVDISIPLGLSYEYQSFVLDARYNLGLNRTYDSEFGLKSKNSVFNITLGYKFNI